MGYNALSDFFPSMMIKPNPNCNDNFCLKQQEIFKNHIIEEPECPNGDKSEETVIHDDNEWGGYYTNPIINYQVCYYWLIFQEYQWQMSR